MYHKVIFHVRLVPNQYVCTCSDVPEFQKRTKQNQTKLLDWEVKQPDDVILLCLLLCV